MTINDGWLVDQLPNAMGSDPLASQMVRMLETIATGIRRQADGVDRYFDVSVAPPEFVRWMGLWLGVTVPAGLDEVRQRVLVSEAGPLIPWRGTRAGLQAMLETLTEAEVTVTDTGGVFDKPRKKVPPKRVVVEVTDPGAFTEQQLLALVRAEIPADASAELLVSGREIEKEVEPSDAASDGEA